MYILTFENNSKVVKLRYIDQILAICKNMNEENLKIIEQNYTEDIEDLDINQFRELMNAFPTDTVIYKLEDVITAVEESNIDDSEVEDLLGILTDEDVEEFELDKYESFCEILCDIEECF